MRSILEKLLLAFTLEPSIPNSDEFINEVAVELDRERKSKRQPRPHSRRILFDGPSHSAPEFGKVVHSNHQIFEIATVKSCKKPHVIDTCERPLKTSGEADRPRGCHIPGDTPFCWAINTAEHADQR